MNKLPKDHFKKVHEFVISNARELDLKLFQYYFESGRAEEVLNELKKYQNSDGGFAYGLEPDFRTPVSSNIATTCAFQYFHKLSMDILPDSLAKALGFFEDQYSKKHQRWIPIPPETNESPHAVWWSYDEDKYVSDEEWGNPTVEIIGYLLMYENSFDKSELSKLKNIALDKLFEAGEVEIHELMCYQRFAKALNDKEKILVYKKISELAQKQVEEDPSKWSGYVSRPLNFVDNPESPVYDTLKDEVEFELDYLIENLHSDGCWYPNWEWGRDEEEWVKIRNEVAGMVSVRNLIILHNFGRISI